VCVVFTLNRSFYPTTAASTLGLVPAGYPRVTGTRQILEGGLGLAGGYPAKNGYPPRYPEKWYPPGIRRVPANTRRVRGGTSTQRSSSTALATPHRPQSTVCYSSTPSSTHAHNTTTHLNNWHSFRDRLLSTFGLVAVALSVSFSVSLVVTSQVILAMNNVET